MNFSDTEILIGVASIAIATISFANALITAWFHRRRERREQSVELYRDFYAPDNIRRVVTPVYVIMLKLKSFEGEKRQELIESLRRGWVGADRDPDRVLQAFASAEAIAKPGDEAHFQTLYSGDQFTELDSMTAFMRFWTMLEQMIEMHVLDRKLTKNLFIGTYCYYHDFLAELRQDMTAHSDPGQTLSWASATERLDKFFGVNGSN